MKAQGIGRMEIATIYGIDKTMVDSVCSGRSWKNAKEEYELS